MTTRRLRIGRRAALPRARWFLLGFSMAAFATMLVFQGYTHNEIGHASTADSLSASSSAVPHFGDGSILKFADHTVDATAVPDRTVALTFDDGPDAKWTPRIMSVLDRYRVPATFFVVGSRVVDHPGIVRAELRAGNDIGSHTYTHANLARLPKWQIAAQLSFTKSAIAGVAGVETALIRPPYSSTPDAITNGDYRAWRTVAHDGYVIVLANRDGEDWRRGLSVSQIVRNATPSDGHGAIVLLHDGGGNRARTLAAVEQLIPRLRARGYHFVRVSQLVGTTANTIRPSPPMDRVRGRLFAGLARTSTLLTAAFAVLVVTVTALSLLRVLLLIVLARKQKRRANAGEPNHAPISCAVSVVVPAYNEEVGIAATVASIVASSYDGPIELVVVDDGSNDATFSVVEGAITSGELECVRVVRQDNAGKAAALNTGLALTTAPIVVMVDADTVLDGDAIAELVQPFADAAVGAVSGNTKIGNRRGLLGNWQHVEYVIGFNLERRAYAILDCMPTVPGAIGAFRRRALEDAGEISESTLAEDTDLTMTMHRTGWRVVYQPTAIAHTEAPSTWRGLWRQRLRWSYGTMQAMWKHRAGLRDEALEGRRFARRGLTYMTLFQIVLPLVGPFLDAATVYGILFFDPWLTLAYWVGFNLVQMGMGWYAFRLDREHAGPLWFVPLQQFVWRQLMYLVVWESILNATAGTRLRWHKLPRLGQSATVAVEGT